MSMIGKIAGVALTTLIATIGPASLARGNFILNGGFEQIKVAGGGFIDLGPGNTSVTGWTILSGSVDLVDTGKIKSYEGTQDLDLDGDSPGAISQSFGTTIGSTYLLSFAFANNWGGGTNASASALVSILGAGSNAVFSQGITHAGSTFANENYQLFSAMFIANSTTTTLKFASTDPSGSFYGVVLDGVSVDLVSSGVVPEPASIAILGQATLFGAALVIRSRRRTGRVVRVA